MKKREIVKIFDIPFADEELWPVVAVLSLIATACAGWLISVYVRKGSIRLDAATCVIRREIPRLFGTEVVEATADQWSVRVVYFSTETKALKIFKRIELRGPEHQEVLLLTDFGKPEAVTDALDSLGSVLGDYDVQVESAAASG